MTEQTKDPIQLAIDALEKADKRHEKIRNALDFIRYGSFSRKDKDGNDGQAMADAGNALSAARHEVNEALRALQSQPAAAHGLNDIRGALFAAEYALGRAMQFNCSSTSQKEVEREALQGVREALAILDQQAAHNPWQPIETAPRDGTLFLAFNKDGDVRKIHDTTYGVGSPGYAEGKRDHWWEYITDDNFCMKFCDPVGWQPLPAAPDLNGEG